MRLSYSSLRNGSRRLLWMMVFLGCAAGLAEGTDVVTFHNDNLRSGLNAQETILTLSNVNSSSFGKLFTLAVDGVVDAEPLYLAGVSFPGQGVHNGLYVVTENDSVYAFDADAGTLMWHVSVLGSGEIASDPVGCPFISPQIGITSTPVIDRSSGPNGTIYVVAMSKSSAGYFQRIHALDITTGQEEFGGPVAIQATYPGTGDNSKNGVVIFDPRQYAERQALLLLNHVVYTAWTSHCDDRPYTGWIVGYDESTLAQTSVLNLTPNGNSGAIWQSGGGMAAAAGNIFLLTANGTFDTTLNAGGFPSNGDYGNCLLRISTNNNHLAVADYFTMYNTVEESDLDADFGSGGVLLTPQVDSAGHPHYLGIGAGKDTNIYIVDLTNMGKFNPDNDNAIYQEIDGALSEGMWALPASYGPNIYFGPVYGRLQQFQFSNAKLSTSPLSRTTNGFPYPGTTPSVSSSGAHNGIVWAIQHRISSFDALYAYNASNLFQVLYSSDQAANGRDQFGHASHFETPMIVNGKVYVGTTNGVAVFGLLQ